MLELTAPIIPNFGIKIMFVIMFTISPKNVDNAVYLSFLVEFNKVPVKLLKNKKGKPIAKILSILTESLNLDE